MMFAPSFRFREDTYARLGPVGLYGFQMDASIDVFMEKIVFHHFAPSMDRLK